MDIDPPGQPGVRIPVVPEYELLRVIGRGAYGEIWLARSLTGALRAVKIVHRQTFESERAFNREFSGMSAFEPISRAHAGFVDILHVGRNDPAGFFYYVMELADDETTGAKIEITRYTPKTLKTANRAALPVQECVRLGLLIAEALEALHRHGLTHRDIKPSNIIFVEGAPKLADIGLVATSGQQSFVGTEGYVPPEGPGTPQADIYSAGKVLYEISMGKDRLDFPEIGTDLEARPDKMQLLELNTVLLKACASQPTKRYRSADEMREDLARLADGRSAKRGGRVPWLVGAAIALLLLPSVWWFTQGRRAKSPIDEAPAFATVSIATEPAGAMVLLGDRMKRAPARFEGIEPGKYPLRVMLPDFDPVETRLELEGGQTLAVPVFKLQRSQGSAQFTSQPDGIEFELTRAGETPIRGTTPTLVELPTGVYETYAKHGDLELRDRVEIKRGEVAQKVFDFATGRLALASEPPGAEIAVDGKIRGLTPLALELTAGNHRVSAHYKNWPLDEREIAIRKGEEVSEAFEFANGSVKIISAPPAATVLQEGRDLGVTPLLIEELNPGEVNYELRLPGFAPATVRGVVQSKRQTFLDARLEKQAGAARADVWENSLGMRFVAVGEVRMSIWETRVQDWDTFCRATGRGSAPPDFSQSGTDPVVKVNWRDAMDFCAWLTEDEQRLNLIEPDESYRLPTDQEWSLAVGLSEESGATPEERDGRVKNIYPWGKQWPPPAGAGNFADQSSSRRRGPIIDGYNDGSAATAPAGSFKPNPLGLHDLSGNVWEWCADLYKPGSRWGVLRGGSWANSNRTELLSAYRNVVDRTERDVIYGFRCVLASTPTAQSDE